MASSSRAAPPSSLAADGVTMATVEPNNGGENRRAAVVAMQPKLLMAALHGDGRALTYYPNEAPAAVPHEVTVDVYVSEDDHSSLYHTPDSTAIRNQSSDESVAESGVDLSLPSASQVDSEGDHSSMYHTPDNTTIPNQSSNESVAEGGIDFILRGLTFDQDTVLHVVAASGDSDNFLASANVIYYRANSLLHTQNSKGDTPFHCAARAGNHQMVSRLIDLAGDVDRAKELLRMENNLNETALHQAVRIGNEILVSLLMNTDNELACFPARGTSPMYLAISLQHDDIAMLLYRMSSGNLSYSGPNGQNALHAAVLRGKETTKIVLGWKDELTEQVDKNGSTPLHFAASWIRSRTLRHHILAVRMAEFSRHLCSKPELGPLGPVLEANPNQLYRPDYEGLFPIHVAASLGVKLAVMTIIKKYPEVAGLRDYKGRTFLHVAVENKRWNIVAYACQTLSLEWILNMQDNSGNTALHLTLHREAFEIFCSLVSNKAVQLNLANNERETPLDLSRSRIPAGFFERMSNRRLEYRALRICHARHGYLRPDQFEEKYIARLKPEDIAKESDKLTDSTRTLGFVSVLIASVTFTSTLALPRGYKNGGTPTFAERYIFNALMMANTVAFILSFSATMNLMFSGLPLIELVTRQMHFNRAATYAFYSLICLVAAFALGAYLVLAPVARVSAIVLCVLMSVVSNLVTFSYDRRIFSAARAIYRRMGIRALPMVADSVKNRLLFTSFPLIIIVIMATILTKGHKAHVTQV